MTPTEHVLDNHVWYALNTTQKQFASGNELAKCFPPEVAPFAAPADHSDAAWRALIDLVAQKGVLAVWGVDLPPELPGCQTRNYFSVDQMVSQQPIPMPASDIEIVDLAAADVPEMFDLIHLTEPGPFFPRTIELGHYVGIRVDGQLAAMAGERMRPQGYSEVSAVCTHPDHRKHGYARLLVSKVSAWNWQRGDVPFLHVDPENPSAIRLYESLGFRKRKSVQILVVER